MQKSGFEKIAIEVVDMQTAKIQLNSSLAKYILYGSALFYCNCVPKTSTTDYLQRVLNAAARLISSSDRYERETASRNPVGPVQAGGDRSSLCPESSASIPYRSLYRHTRRSRSPSSAISRTSSADCTTRPSQARSTGTRTCLR